MKVRDTYTGYSIGCGIVWAVIWFFVGTRADDQTRKEVLLAFIGWVSGWTSATIARAVYPPPRRKIPDSVKWGLAVLTVLNMAVVGARLLKLLRRPAG
jgi:hypothetical protein